MKNKLNEMRPRRYFEPFLGGGAVYFSLNPKSAILSDINEDLVNAYLQVRDNYKRIIAKLKKIPINKKTYLAVRLSEPESSIDRAVRLIYLNRTCFGGIYRTNKVGKFNVPYGGGQRTPNLLWEKNILEDASDCLKNTRILACDFEKMFDFFGEGDLVYCDPCYSTSYGSGFVRYNKKIFSWDDQIRLAKACERVASKGAIVIISNAFDDGIIDLYRYAKIETVYRGSYLCPDSTKRGQFKELLLTFNCSQ